MGGFLLNMDVSEAGNMFRSFFVCAYLVQIVKFGTDLPIVLSILAQTAKQQLLNNLLAGHIS